MRTNEKLDEITRDQLASTLKALLSYRKMTIAELGRLSGVPYRTIQGYTNGRIDIRNCRAIALFDLAQALDVDPRVLIGKLPMDTVYENDKKPYRTKPQAYLSPGTKI